MAATSDKIEVENVNTPGAISRVDAVKYADMRTAMLRVLPAEAPGLNHAEIMEAVRPHLDQQLFPGGAKSGWWSKTVQLDLEAKGIIARSDTKPLRWYRVMS